MVRVYLTVTGESVSSRHIYLSFFLQAFTKKNMKHSRSSKEMQAVGSTWNLLKISSIFMGFGFPDKSLAVLSA